MTHDGSRGSAILDDGLFYGMGGAAGLAKPKSRRSPASNASLAPARVNIKALSIFSYPIMFGTAKILGLPDRPLGWTVTPLKIARDPQHDISALRPGP